jgi:hypothetical protein
MGSGRLAKGANKGFLPVRLGSEVTGGFLPNKGAAIQGIVY